MRLKTNLKPLGQIVAAALMAGLTSGCLDDAKLNTDTVVYTPEERPLNVIAGDPAEYRIGESESIILSGRLVGTVSNETVLWEQTSGTPIQGDIDWTKESLTIPMPSVDGIESFGFKISARDADGNIINDAEGNPLIATTNITVFDPAVIINYEVEDSSVAELLSVAIVSAGDANYLNGASGSHTADITPGASVKFTINSEQDSFFTLYGRFGIPASGYGSKVAMINVNGVEIQKTIEATGNFADYRLGVIKLNAGENIIEVGGGWNYYRLDKIFMIPAAEPAAPSAVSPTLVNSNAQASAKAIIEFLAANYGSATLSGQTEYPNKIDGEFPLTEFNKIVSATGDDAPAIVAFDFIDFSASRVANGNDSTGLSEAMIAEHKNKNVMLSALWHWNAPMHLLDADGDSKGDVSGSEEQAWWNGFYTKATSFDLAAALADENSPEYVALIADIDTISAELKKFADADIPILWRPLHEAEGEWFWWGAAGPEALKKLWRLMYERMTVTHGLNNLIWVFTHAGDLDENWYPGNDYVDIVGYDGYDGNNADNPFKSQYDTLKGRFNGKKIIALTETGTIPNVELMHEQNAWWSFFTTWNSGGENYGPDGIDAATIDANYNYEGVINLADIPGGRVKVGAGVWDNFDPSTAGFEAQLNWNPTTGLSTSQKWKTSGTHALSLVKDLSTETDPTGAMLQVYPTGGINVKDVSTITVSANALNTGLDTKVKLFIKHSEKQEWVDSGDVAVVDGGVELQIDVSAYEQLAGLGLVFEGIDPTATAAEFYLDNVRADDTVLYDFEPAVSGWETQINWLNVPGITVSNDWSTSGRRSLALFKDLSKLAAPTDAIFQVYPTEGFDVSQVAKVKVSANAVNTGPSTTVKLFVKHGEKEVWADSGAAAIVDGSVELEIDVSAYEQLTGMGFQYQNFDAAATDARFYLDNVRLDDKTVYDFEGTGNWEFQVNWTPTAGIQLAQDWSVDGENALVGVTQLVEGDDNIILQVYPEGGLLLGDVTKLKITAYTKDAGDAVQAQLFAKDKAGTWRDGGAVDMTADGVELSLDIADMEEIQGFGVRFMGPSNSATESKYYIDKVIFE